MQLRSWKRPSRQKWKIGDVFSIPLNNEKFTFGQIIGTHLMKTSPICILFNNLKPNRQLLKEELDFKQVISVLNTDNSLLANFTFTILFNSDILASPIELKTYHSDQILIDLANVYYG